jgi:hypothetical protein
MHAVVQRFRWTSSTSPSRLVLYPGSELLIRVTLLLEPLEMRPSIYHGGPVTSAAVTAQPSIAFKILLAHLRRLVLDARRRVQSMKQFEKRT